MLEQPKWIALRLAPSNLGPRLYPALAARIDGEELVVLSDEGAVYVGDHAWLMCLYAIKHYRPCAQRRSRPPLLPFPLSAFAILSGNLHRISQALGLLV